MNTNRDSALTVEMTPPEIACDTTARQAALAFTEGVRCGWLASDLIAWYRDHLVSHGRIKLSCSGTLHAVVEPAIGSIVLSDLADQTPSASPKACLSDMPGLLAAARERVLQHLRETVSVGQARFVQAAIYSGRIARSRAAGGRSQWRASLTEDCALSDQVLALFALDAVENPTDYERDLAVCDACGMVSLGQSLVCARGCPSHPYGTLDNSTARTRILRSGIIAKKP